MIRSQALRIVPAFALGLLAACGGGESSAAGGADGTPGVPSESGPTTSADDFVVPDDVLSPEEANAKAQSEITPENADAEYEKLKQALGG